MPDTNRFLVIVKRHIEVYGKAHRKMAVGGDDARRGTLRAAKGRQVEDMLFHKDAD